MTDALLTIILGLLSAFSLALVNFAVKRGGDVLTTRMIMSMTMALTAIPVAVFVPFPSQALWGALLISLLVHGAYQWAMIRALHRGDLSLVFPVMRGAGPVLTAFFAWVVLNETLSPGALVGLFLASVGVVIFALPEKLAPEAQKLNRAALFYAVLAAIGVGAYSAVDARAVRLADTPWTFIAWLYLIDWIFVTLTTVFTRRGTLMTSVRAQWKGGVAAGLIGSFSFALLLYAFTLAGAATVTALRETAVVFGAILGWLFLNESFGLRRVVSAAVIAAGLALMQLAA